MEQPRFHIIEKEYQVRQGASSHKGGFFSGFSITTKFFLIFLSKRARRPMPGLREHLPAKVAGKETLFG
jgi:hypothetical protein